MAHSPQIQIERDKQSLWIWKNGGMLKKEITFSPHLYHLFDTILVNASYATESANIEVNFDISNSIISVWSNAKTFDSVEGFAKKLCTYHNWYGQNVFWSELTIECRLGHEKRTQVFTNMSSASQPTIETFEGDETWTKVSFIPDFAKCGPECLEDDTVDLLKRRVVDVAGCLGMAGKVVLDGTHIQFKMFEDYVMLYPETSALRFYEKVNDNWEVCVCLSDGRHEQVSFVNGIWTRKGGSHVDYLTKRIAKSLYPSVHCHPNAVRCGLRVFVNARIINPIFDSQTKEHLTTAKAIIRKAVELRLEFLETIKASTLFRDGIFDLVYEQNGSEKLKIKKLRDAYFAGTDKSGDCTLIITEGDSAASFAKRGLSVVGQDYYGLYPIDGKLLNVRTAIDAQQKNNIVIQNIKKILGLQDGKDYHNADGLRYGHLLIMADQDWDGSHIRGLFINFIQFYWPSLLKVPNFMQSFKSPIIRAKKKKADEVLYFYSIPDYEKWKVEIGKIVKEYSIKYYKGLGSTERTKTLEYFANLGRYTVEYMWVDEDDDNAIELAFSRTEEMKNKRKEWIQTQVGIFNSKEMRIRIRDFIHTEFKYYCLYDLKRSIPSMVDGLKIVQRKAIFGGFKKPILHKEIQIEDFSSYVRKHTAYRHGASNIVGAVVNMSHSFVGSNNISLFEPNGQFGTRDEGGKDVASARYNCTKLSAITPFIFIKKDDCVLNYLNEDGKSIEPTWYIPVIPMSLVNGCKGIGTVHSTFIPNHDPLVVISNLKHMLSKDNASDAMLPFYKGFRGSIKKSKTQYTTRGRFTANSIRDKHLLRITELPIGSWTDKYDEFLYKAQHGKDPFIQTYKDYKTREDKVDFQITLTPDQMTKVNQVGILKKFKLTTTKRTTNMRLFDANGELKKYDTPEQILEDFFKLRLEFYEKRRNRMLHELKKQIVKLRNGVRFIDDLYNEKIIPLGKEDKEICNLTKKLGYEPLPKVAQVVDEKAEEEVEKGKMETDSLKEFGYLLLTPGLIPQPQEKDLLEKKLHDTMQEYDDLQNTDAVSIWLKELEALEQQLAVNEHEGKIDDESSSSDDESSSSDDESSSSDDESEAAARRQRAKKRERDESSPEITKAAKRPAAGRQRGTKRERDESSPEISEETSKRAVQPDAKGQTKGVRSKTKKTTVISDEIEEISDTSEDSTDEDWGA